MRHGEDRTICAQHGVTWRMASAIATSGFLQVFVTECKFLKLVALHARNFKLVALRVKS